MWIRQPFFKYGAAVLLALLIIFMFGKIDYFIWPFQKTIATIFFPILISGLLYYILRPVVRSLSKHIHKTVSIALVYLCIIGIGYAFVYFAGAIIGEQVQQFSEQFPEKLKDFSEESKEIVEENNFGMFSADDIEQRALKYLSSMTRNIATLISTITSVATVLVIVPFIVFYFLKDDDKLIPFLLRFIPDDVKHEGERILKDVDKTLFTYITGQFLIAFTDGVLMYIGYLIIGLDYALILALFAMFLTVVPFLGPLIGVIPALCVGLLNDPFMALKIIIVLIIVQQLEGNLVTPQVMGNRLNLHPLTVITLLLVAGSIYGFIGILIAIPLYSVVKVIVKDFWRFYNLRQRNITNA
ncbi:AI-2E family transporter [Bacillus canaveralius]|uniref:AI-2E family transporter n=1 Tax=Bacillus canaveralius TaxID=1403243 RepID=A0A2N5GLJ4_9BACI|nr:AI-2E family transporter [Bacillus canaveralius]PLR82513.1 AI-2E family transporter [Bacillus canaveralius]PLR95684.1 AI-2E family transporter [Bacillus canaveralius]